MANLISKLFNEDGRRLKQVEKKIQKVLDLEEEYKNKSDEDLKAMTPYLKEKLANGATLDDIFTEAFATAREACRRVIGEFPYPVQLMGAAVLQGGDIAEMKTGEGKTLTSVMAVYLNALEGKGVHVVTVNEYLSKRDSEWMGQIHRWLGLTVGLNLRQLSKPQKRAAYACDITYTTNSELGFDYLRDNMVTRVQDRVLRGLNFALVDEVDSILIDESRTPLIISGGQKQTANLYLQTDRFVKRLKEEEDYEVDVKSRSVQLTEQGVSKAERVFRVENLYDLSHTQLLHHINQALKANYVMMRDVEYVVDEEEDEIVIVDPNTGRLMKGRQWSDGLHQAVEAKEGISIKQETTTLATITYQNFFRLYNKLSGMTGTAKTEEEEFLEIYNMFVVEIPTNKPVKRIDYPDAVYGTKKAKFKALVDEVVERHAKGQPILVGTIAVETSELISKYLKERKIPHQVLNAKNHAREADIIAHAGRMGAVTIATNMAGRGTDIKLGEGVRELGGLCVLGSERHESRRIDNQLRGRSGRQGDPGESRFYISLEDDLMRLFGSEKMMGMFRSLGVQENEQIEHRMLSSAIEKAQKKIESNNFATRKSLLEYDEVNNEQREVIYRERRKVLDGENMRDQIMSMISDTVDSVVDTCIGDDQDRSDWDLHELHSLLVPIIPLEHVTPEEDAKVRNKAEFKEYLKEKAVKLYEAKEAEFEDPEQIREMERVILLRTIDRKWMDHIDDMDQLRQGIGLAAYGQKDPKVEYKMEGYDMFNSMTSAIQEDTLKMLYHVKVEQKVEREEVAKVTGTNKDDTAVRAPKKREAAKIYPNDPCPCGSGKKYKQCHGRKLV